MLSHDVSKIPVPPASVYRPRAINRSKTSKKLGKLLFKNTPSFLLNWDSKVLPSFSNESVKTLEHKVVVLASGKDFEHLLGIPVVPKDLLSR